MAFNVERSVSFETAVHSLIFWVLFIISIYGSHFLLYMTFSENYPVLAIKQDMCVCLYCQGMK